MTPDETAEKVLEGVLGHKDMTFSEFRQAVFEAHPTYLSDNEIHDLYVKHVGPTEAMKVVERLDGYTQEQHREKIKEARQRAEARRAERQAAVDQAMAWRAMQDAKREAKPEPLQFDKPAYDEPRGFLDLPLSEIGARAKKKFLSIFARPQA